MVSDSKPKEIFAMDLDNKPNSDCHDNFMLSKLTNRHPYNSALTIFLSSLMKLLCFPPKTFQFFNTIKNQNISISSHNSHWNWRKICTIKTNRHTVIAKFYVTKTSRPLTSCLPPPKEYWINQETPYGDPSLIKRGIRSPKVGQKEGADVKFSIKMGGGGEG